MKRIQGDVYRRLLALHQLQRTKQRDSYTRSLRLDLEFPDVAAHHDEAANGGGPEGVDLLSLDPVCLAQFFVCFCDTDYCLLE